MSDPAQLSKAERRALRERMSAYHEAELAKLLAHVRDGFEAFEAGRLDAFELDGIIHHYHRAAQKLYSFCAVGGTALLQAARTLDWLHSRGDDPVWWDEVSDR